MDSKHYASLTAAQIAAGVRTKAFSAAEVTEAALVRAHELDPKIKAFVTILDDRARAAAKAVDANVAAGKPMKLAGVPVAIKDNLCVDGTRTTCSSKILSNYVPPYTGTAVQRILDEGGIPIGKTNLDEFAMGSSTENSAFFTTRNPWDVQRVPGDRRADRRLLSPRASRRSRWVRTRADRFASPQRCAASPVTSRRTAVCRATD